MAKKPQYQEHPATSVFPMMSDSEYAEFKEDIARNGCREPIVLWKGQLLDGRNRLRACEELDKKPPIVSIGDHLDPVAYVMSCNLHRRHLTVSQRSICAAKLVKLQSNGAPDGARTIDDAATAFGVGSRTVDRAVEDLEFQARPVRPAVEGLHRGG